MDFIQSIKNIDDLIKSIKPHQIKDNSFIKDNLKALKKKKALLEENSKSIRSKVILNEINSKSNIDNERALNFLKEFNIAFSDFIKIENVGSDELKFAVRLFKYKFNDITAFIYPMIKDVLVPNELFKEYVLNKTIFNIWYNDNKHVLPLRKRRIVKKININNVLDKEARKNSYNSVFIACLIEEYEQTINNINLKLIHSKKMNYGTKKANKVIKQINGLTIKASSQLKNIINNSHNNTFNGHSLINLKKELNDWVENIKKKLADEQLKKLADKKLKEKTLPRKNGIMKFRWQHIRFEDGLVNFYGLVGYYYPFKNSKYIYNYIKDYVMIPEEWRFQVTFDINTKKITNVKGLEILDEVFNLMDVRITLDNYDIGDVQYFSDKIVGGFTNQKIINTFLLDKIDKSKYFEYLCQRQSISHRIIPVKEVRSFKASNSMIAEYAFLFGVNVSSRVYIIWESVEESRATHIFKCNDQDYVSALQKIFDYISSSAIKNKRQLLRQSKIPYFTGDVNYCGSNQHDNFFDWASRLRIMCR